MKQGRKRSKGIAALKPKASASHSEETVSSPRRIADRNRPVLMGSAFLPHLEFACLILHESDDAVFDLLAGRRIGIAPSFRPGGLTITVCNQAVDAEILESLGCIGINETPSLF